MKQEYFKNCYQLLGLNEKEKVNDEMVFEAYNNMKIQIENFRKEAKTSKEIEYLKELEIAIDDSYRVLKNEEKRKMYNEFLAEIRKREDKQIKNKLTEEIKETTSHKDIEEDEEFEEIEETRVKNLKYIPIYRGKFNETPKSNREDDDER